MCYVEAKEEKSRKVYSQHYSMHSALNHEDLADPSQRSDSLYDYLGEDESKIRLITIQPAISPLGPVHCSLSTVEFHDAPSYEALSYCWGPPELKTEIICNHQPRGITENLSLALRSLPQPFSTRRIWVDALCINQNDTKEKSSQVAMMRDIYRQAHRTVVWLGADYEDSQLIASYSERAAAAPSVPLRTDMLRDPSNDDVELGCYMHFCVKMDEKVNNAGKTHHPTGPEYSALVHLLRRPYFSRSWITQEIYVARDITIQWGKTCMSVEKFAAMLRVAFSSKLYLQDHNPYGYDLIQQVASKHTRTPSTLSPDPLEELLARRSLKATDPRDKVYAFLGLLNHTNNTPLDLIPNYELSVTECYCATAKAILRYKRNLDCLYVERPSTSIGELPTWVPDWSSGTNIVSLVPERWVENLRTVSRYDVSSCGDSKLYDPIFQGDNILVVSGFLEDEIAEMTKPMLVSFGDIDSNRLNEDFAVSLWQSIKFFVELLIKSGKRYDILVDWASFALMANCYPEKNPGYAFRAVLLSGTEFHSLKDSKRCYNEWVELVGILKVFSYLKILGIQKSSIVMSFYYAALAIIGSIFITRNNHFDSWITPIVGRRLAKTSNGFLALVPQNAERGHKIAICKGGRFPLLLQPQEARWELIGYVYVHGYMRGEKWDNSKCYDIEIT